MNKNIKNLTIFSAKLAVTFGILYYLLQKIEFSRIINVILSADIFYVVLAVILAFLVRYLTACQTKILLTHQKIFLSTFRVFTINLISSFYTLFLPGDISGSVIKWHKFSATEGKRAQSFAVIFASRLVNTLFLVAVGLVAFTVKNPFQTAKINFLVIFLLVLTFLVFIPILSKPALSFVEKYLRSFLAKISPNLIKEKLEKIWASLKSFQELSKQNIILVIFFAFTGPLVGITCHYMLALSINLDLSIIIIAWITTVAALVQILPISISGLGVREGALFFLLDKYQVPIADALSFSFLIFAVFVFVSLVGGIFELNEFLRYKPPPT